MSRDDDLRRVLEVGLDVVPGLARRAGEVARRLLRADTVAARAKGERGDVVTDADLEAERLIVDGLRSLFPGHRIQSEEAGRLDGDPAWTWLVDPLDGTNNLALGLPLLGVCIALVHDGEPVLSVIHDSFMERTLTAVAGGGARCDGVGVSIPAPPALMTVSWMQGYGVDADDEFADRAPRALARSHKRLLRTWAPSVDWALTATGRVAAVVAYRNEIEDLVAGLLLVREAGGLVCNGTGAPLGAGTVMDGETVLAGHPDGVAAVLATLARAGIAD